MPPCKNRTAFTLLELLVTLTLGIILLALAFHALKGVRTRAAVTQSTANLKVMSGGLSAYIADFQGKLPDSMEDARIPTGWTKFWFNALAYYIEGESYFPHGPKQARRPRWQICPGRSFPEEEMALYYGWGMTVTYGWNYYYFGYNRFDLTPWFNRGFASRITDVQIPSQTIIIGTVRELRLGLPIGPNDTNVTMLSWEKPESTRFDGSGLYLFLDGHVERLTPAQAVANDSYLFKRAKTDNGFQ